MNLHLPTAATRQVADDPASALHGVLVVDDDALVRDTLALQLESDGSQVATAASIGAAQAALDADLAITVVVCDIHLAQESGFDLAGALADLRPERLATEIVFITGNATSDTAIEALRHHAFDLIRKPVRRADLVARVGAAHLSAMLRRKRQAMLDQVETRLAEGEALKRRLVTALHDAECQNRTSETGAASARHDLLAVISHELRTPLIPIVGLADIMLGANDLTPEEVREFAGLIRDGGNRLGMIIERTLAYLDAERQHALSEKADFEVGDLISAALYDISKSETTPVPEIEIACPIGLRAWGVLAMLAEALGELVDNAIKACPTGSKVRIEAHVLANGGVSVEVTDSGPGLPETVRNNLGVPFLQGDTSLTRLWDGVGIGLARAKKIAQLSRGDIAFAEALDFSGTQVSLILRGAA